MATTRFHFPRFILILLASLLCISTQFFDANHLSANTSTDSATELRASTLRMNQWLGHGEAADGWRRYLLLNVLDSQAAKGWQADITTLQEVHDRFSRDAKGLDHPAFLDVKNAIANQIRHLSKINYPNLSDFKSAAEQALGQFQRPSLDAMKRDRDVAKYELQLLKKYYRSRYASRKRALIFVELELDEAIAFLDTISFELPPEVSAGKIRSLVRDQSKILSEINDKIDALPLAPPEPEENETEGEELEGLESPVLPDDDATPPQPDSDTDSLADLEKRKTALKERINELTERFRKISRADKPRQDRRTESLIRLGEFHLNFLEVGRSQVDPYFVSAANALDKFYFHYGYGTEDNLQESFLNKVMELKNLTRGLDDPTDRIAHVKIGQIIEWLERRNQLPNLTAAIRARHSNPNFLVSVSSNLINAVGQQSQSESRVVNEIFFGRLARGNAIANANVNIELLEDPNQIHASVHLLGSLQSQTYVRQRSLRVAAQSNGVLEGRRSIYANVNGVLAGDANVAASLSSRFGGISGFGSQFGFVGKLAEKAFRKEKSRNEAEASRRAEKQMFEQFNSQTEDAISAAKKQLADARKSVDSMSGEVAGEIRGIGSPNVVPTPRRSRRVPVMTNTDSNSFLMPNIHMRSSYDRVEIVGHKDSISQLAAPTIAIEHSAGSDVQFRLHESMISNYLDEIFAGKTFRQTELDEIAEDLTGEVPEFLQAKKDDEGEAIPEFVISFDESRPIQVKFEDNKFGLTINAKRFQQGDRSIDVPLVIDLKQSIVRKNGELFVKEDGIPKFKISEEDDPSFEEVAFLAILEKRVAAEAEAAASDPDKKPKEALPPNFLPEIKDAKNPELLRAMQLGLFKFKDGWLYVGWNYGGGPVETPAIWTEQVVNQIEGVYTPLEAPAEIESLDSTSVPTPTNSPIEVHGTIIDANLPVSILNSDQ